MYKVMIVDDEPIVSLTIKAICNWDENNINIAYEAENGKKALKILEENDDIDIIITDLNMPIMDGIDLIKNIKDKKLNQKIIVLSSYKDYALVREAFKLGVEDYILKTEIDENNLLELLNKLIDDIEKEGNKKKDRLKEEIIFIKQGIMRNLLENTYSLDIDKNIIKNNINLGENNIIVLFLWIDDYKKIENRYSSDINQFKTSVKDLLSNIVNKEEYKEIISKSSQEYIILYSSEKKDKKIVYKRVNTLLSEIRSSLFNYLNVTATIGISSLTNGYENISKVYREAEKNARFRFLLGKNKVICSDDIFKIKNEEYKSILNNSDDFFKSLKEEDSKEIMKELDKILETINNQNINDLSQVKIYYSEIIFTITNAIKEVNGDMKNILKEDINLYEKINMFETFEEMNLWIKDIVCKLIKYKEENKNIKYSPVIQKSLKYINDNYRNSNLVLKDVCNRVELSENYFSILFSNEVGISFKEYLINLRINKAKNLILNSNMKIYEICEDVGYKNVEHFSRIFKKVAGVSPNNFKKN